MLKNLKDKNGIAVASEYLLVFFLVVGMLSGITIYFRRTLQARIRDAKLEMVDIVKTRAGAASGTFVGNLYYEYEPYYANTVANITRDSWTATSLDGGGTTGIFKKQYDEWSAIDSYSMTAPPREAN